VIIALVGPLDFVKIQLPIMVVASTIGVWLFFVQHQFEPGYWRAQDEWDFEEAALQGSSYLKLPKPLQWLTANIGLHHVHHLSSRIPNYRLQACIDRFPELSLEARRLDMRGSLRCAALALWCEDRQRLIRFHDLEPAGAAPGQVRI
jgi:omega-6 fatty acid desaturase (delta-12 desaturase)